MKQIIKTDKAPQAAGPYSQAVKAGGWLYTSGQLPLDPVTGQVAIGPFATQVERVLANLRAVIEAGGGTIDQVVKVTAYLADMNDFPEFNGLYEKYFGAAKPARSCIAAKALPQGVSVMADAVVCCDEAG
ncbi:MAG: Rid family detoxifying hydrolase [Smithellaceae bacterium]|nr:Rid family detoxifying hydrolase [Smithellaceae bacterium]